MALSRLDIIQFRNLNQVELELDTERFNLIYGQNGSGKTSLLEAIYYLSMGRLFRSSLADRIMHHEADSFSIFAHLLSQQQQITSMGIERQRDKAAKIRINGKDQNSIAELTQLLPVRLINSQSYSLLDGGPLFRRKYLDWGLFYLNNDFLSLWQKYERVLKQRNAALRNHSSRHEIQIWTNELVEISTSFDHARQEYIKLLVPVLMPILTKLLDIKLDLQIEYERGWNKDKDLATILADCYPKDAALGYTQYGPHKADLKAIIHGFSAKDFLSRGQQKLFVCGMILAQGKLLSSLANKRSIFLVDDLPSELDSFSLQKMVGLLEELATQVFITAIDCNTIAKVSNKSTKLFHVEHGKVIAASS